MEVNSKYRPADVLVAPATLGDSFKSAGVAAYTAECRKHSSDDPKCQELGWVCIPLAVETYGNWDKEAQNTFSCLASLLSISQCSPKIHGRLNLSLVRSVARKILSRRVVLGISRNERSKEFANHRIFPYTFPCQCMELYTKDARFFPGFEI